jgi:L-lactate permease
MAFVANDLSGIASPPLSLLGSMPGDVTRRHKKCAALAVANEEHVVRMHGASNAHRDGLATVIFLYRLTVETGAFQILQATIGSVAADRRLQLLLIAFSFGAQALWCTPTRRDPVRPGQKA